MTQRYSSGTVWEREIQYSRAVRRGAHVFVSGTTAMDRERLVGKSDAAAQTRFVFRKIETALQAVGAGLPDVVRTRMYITDARDADAVTSVHAQVFDGICPCATLLVVKGFISPELLVEVEVDAIVEEP